ncbi:AAA family ATPase [Humisphaera borealis]|uniref:AAA family ATPase n=1 Tax=Humisphaera borealis TaxID=2807512 RepID=A0A7M2WXN0_9BACT|nr:AAA family ATPase [Humisphaera borealis]QOV89270.1 AAA family ATPase [Humisphaera borealis]
MFVQLTCAIVDADASNRQEMAAFLSRFGIPVIAQLATVDGLPALLGRSEAPQLVIVNLDPNAPAALRAIGHLPRQNPGVSFFVMSQLLDANLLMEAMHLGVKEFIPLPMSEEKFSNAIERVATAHGAGKKARIIHVVPTVGGCGSTTVACNVAASLAKSGKTVLVDLDLMRGGVASCFDTRPRFTIADVMEAAEKLDKTLLDNALAVHANSKVALLARPELPEDTQRVNGPGVSRLLNLLGRLFDYVVIDSVMSIDPIYSAAIAAADVNILTMQLNIPSAKNAERFVGAMRRMGVEANKIKIVVNRYVKKGNDIEPEEVERALGLKVSWTVPNDFKNAIQAINFGEPVVLRAPRSDISLGLTALAQGLDNRAGKALAA